MCCLPPRLPPQFDFSSIISQIKIPGAAEQQQGPGLSLHDLLSTTNTTPLVENMSETTIDAIISNLPHAIVPKDASTSQKRQIILRVLRSPQFMQGAVSLTAALREGALQGVADSLKVPISTNDGSDPVEILVKGVRREVEREFGN